MIRAFRELSIDDLFRFTVNGLQRMLKKKSDTEAYDAFTKSIVKMNPDDLVDVLF